PATTTATGHPDLPTTTLTCTYLRVRGTFYFPDYLSDSPLHESARLAMGKFFVREAPAMGAIV
ncbi:hypothetical protein O3S80_51270, partial [Streptomyces sp. Lzd4kr]|nr:hypothetical protein [Streptomyces sp. Lzd4kr]